MNDNVNQLYKTETSIRNIFAASIISASAAAIFLILPLIIGVATEDLDLSNEQAGFIASSYFGGYFLVCSSAIFWIHRLHWQLVSIMGHFLLIIGLITSVSSANYPLILIAFFTAGCGGGILFSLCLCILGETKDPDRYFGVKLTAEQILAAGMLFLLPVYVIAKWGFVGVGLTLVVVFLVLGSATVWLPTCSKKQLLQKNKTAGSHSTGMVWLALLFLMIFMAGLSGVWAFIERMANDAGMSNTEIGRALSFGVIGGGFGALAAALAGDKFGRTIPLLFSLLILSGVLFTLNSEFSALAFGLCCIALSGMWNYSLAYQMGIVAALDSGGQMTVLMSSALALGAMLGPAFAGQVIDANNYTFVNLLAFFCIAFATVIFISLNRKMNA